jgi:indolepyruvate ferredoxin oxidoreductase, beta subunit
MAEIKALPNHIALDADSVASELGSVKAANMVILGAASPHLDIAFEKLENAIRTLFGRKGEELVTLNLNALNTGRKFSMEAQK